MTALDSDKKDDAKMALMSLRQALTGPAQQAGMSMESMMTSKQGAETVVAAEDWW